MTPAQLTPESFAAYPPLAKNFAVQHLPLLRRLPLAVSPSFLQQIQALDTSFPDERESLRWQCEALQNLPGNELDRLIAPLSALPLSPELQAFDWLHAPAAFIAELTAYLWSSGEMPKFRAGAHDLFAAIPARPDSAHRLVIVLMGQGSTPDETTVLHKLRKQGVFLTALDRTTCLAQAAQAIRIHADESPGPYSSWYVDGGEPHAGMQPQLATAITVTYPGLAPIRGRVLERMQSTIASGNAGAEMMRTRLADTTPDAVGAPQLTPDPVLGRFYTELFTLSSGPQIFSTSFVQWTGRELARRARPRTLLLRYAPRQQHRDLNELFTRPDAGALDPQASLRDAEMGAYLNWIEMNRITAPGKLTFAAVVEGQPFAVLIGSGTRPGTVCPVPMSLEKALRAFA